MASPSNIPNHPLVQMLDREGDAFPTGSSYYIKNACSNFRQALAFSQTAPAATTYTAHDEPDCKWWIQYENNDRSRIALKNARTGGYLAVDGTNCKAGMYLSEQPVWWYVYQGGTQGTYWLGTSQSPDGFLHTWECYQGDGAFIGMLTNRDGNWRDFYNMPYSVFEEWSSGMSWGLEPTPELRQWKEQQKASAPSQQQQAQGACCNNCGQGCPDVQKAANEAQNASVEKGEELAKREETLKAMEDDLRERKQAHEDKGKDLEKSEGELKKREEAARAAEERIKKSKKGGKAEHLASQEENDKLKDENKSLQDQIQAANDQMEQLRQQLQQAQEQPQNHAADSGRRSLLNGNRPPPIRKPEIKRPGQQLPAVKRPGQGLPEMKKPGQHLPTGYNSDMMKRFEVGKKAMGMKT